MDNENEFNALRVLEAALFSSSDLLTINDLEPLFEKRTDIGALLTDLAAHYEGRGVELVCRGRAWGFRTAPDLSDRLQSRQVVTKPLSRAATETLAIIAYHQPVTRPEIENVRGVSVSKSTLDILIKEELIKTGRRREEIGRPLTWVTTDHFLDQFGLTSLKDLPNLKEMKESGMLELDSPVFMNNDDNEENVSQTKESVEF